MNRTLKKLFITTSLALVALSTQGTNCYATTSSSKLSGELSLQIGATLGGKIIDPFEKLIPLRETKSEQLIEKEELIKEEPIEEEKINNNSSNHAEVLNTGIYQEDDPNLVYSEGWASASSTNYDCSFIKVAKVPGANVKFTFTGTSFEIFGIKSSMNGIATINIDGKDVANVNCYNRFTLYNTSLYSAKDLTNTTHTVTITNAGDKDNRSSSTDISLDKITINDTNKVLTTGVYEQENDAIVYSGTWNLATSPNYSNSSMRIAKVPGSTAKFTFSGTSFKLYGLKYSAYGSATVSIDGKDVDIIDCYSPSTLYNTTIYESPKLTNGVHTVVITSNTAINPASSSTDFSLDKIAINGDDAILTPGTYEETDEKLSYTGNWADVQSSNYSDGSIKVAKAAGSVVRFTFSGTSFDLYGLKCRMYGTATINIDGVDVAYVDSYSPATKYDTLLYSSNTLKSGIHNVTITTNSTINPASTSTDFAIDKIIVHDAKILTTGMYENDNLYLDYSKGWTTLESSNYHNGSISISKAPGSTLKFSFSGTSFKIYGIKSKFNGTAKVNIDGVDVQTIDAYNKYTLYNTLLYSNDNLTDGTHTVTITNLENKNINSESTDFSIDRITINDTNTVLSTGTYEQNDNALIYSGTWANVDSSNYSNGSMNVSKVPGSALNFTFSGTSFEIYGIKSAVNGMATISIDGSCVDTIDTYSPYTLYNSLLYSKDNLTDGIHTVTIASSEVKNVHSSSTDISIDKININDTKKVLPVGVYDENNDALIYSGQWVSLDGDRYNNGSMKLSKAPGSSVTFKISGDSFDIYGLKAKMYGNAKISIDGGSYEDLIDEYSATTIANTLVYRKTGLSKGDHTITITTNPTCTDFSIDKIVVYNSDKVLTTGIYEDNCSSINYSDNWIDNKSDKYNNDSVKLSKVTDDTASFTFSGTSFKLYGNMCTMYGMARVNIDGVDVGNIDAYSPYSLYNELLFKSDTLQDGIHYVTITNTGTKNPLATSNDISIDRIFINEPLPNLEPGEYEDTYQSLVYSGQWVPYYSDNYSNGTIMLSKAPNSSLEFTFNGTSLDLYGVKYTMYGYIKVFIDGVEVVSIDTFSNPTEYTKLIFSKDNLENKAHNVKIIITDDKNPEATDTDFALDKIVIR